MTKKDIIRMARKAYDKDMVETWGKTFWTFTQEELERFAALVAAAEREACAKLADKCIKDSYKVKPQDQQETDYLKAMRVLSEEFAIAIRARGDK